MGLASGPAAAWLVAGSTGAGVVSETGAAVSAAADAAGISIFLLGVSASACGGRAAPAAALAAGTGCRPDPLLTRSIGVGG